VSKRRRAKRDAREAAMQAASLSAIASSTGSATGASSAARRTRAFKIANMLAAVVLAALIITVWRDPTVVIRAEFAKQRILLGARSQSIEAGDHRWVYAELDADTPNAQTVVLVHGFTGSKENWYRVARQLKGRYRVVMPDLPGWGQSERKDDTDYGFLAQSQRLFDFIGAITEKTGGQPVVLIGHSMGGGIVAMTAARGPGRVARVGLIDAAGVRFDDNQFGLDVLAGKNPFAVEDAASFERYLATVFHNDAARPWIPWPADKIYIAQRRRDAAFEQGVLDKIGRGNERFLPGSAAVGINQPTLLLWCKQDRVIDPSAMALYARIVRHATQVMLDDCGHMSVMERPGDVAGAIEMLAERGRWK
jgi:abhydrolase domain-containing protein 6